MENKDDEVRVQREFAVIRDSKKDSTEHFSVKVPIRIKSGSFSQEYLSIVTSCDERKIPWSHLRFVCLGCVEEALGGSEAPKSNMRSVIRKLLFGDNKDDRAKRQTRVQYILDLFVENSETAFRFDSVNINYKSFLGDVSYISFHNFKRLFQKIVDQARDSYFNRSAIALLRKRQDKIYHYASVYDFELDCQNARAHLEREVHWSDIEKDMELGDRSLEYEKTGGRELPDDHYRVVDGILDDATGDIND
jgi:hypothetical protein